MTQRPLRLGVIGGGIGSAVGNVHRIAATMDGRWSVEAGCFSTDAQVNRQTANLWGVEATRNYINWRALLEAEHESLDALLVLTPTPSHAKLVIEAIKAGFHIICEKSLATSSAEIVKINEELKQHKRFLAVTYNYSGYPMLRQLKKIISNGELGNITQVQIEMPQEGYARVGLDGRAAIPQAWRLVDRNVPTISLDLGVHLHHTVYFLTGARPVELVAMQDSYGAFPQVVDNVMCMARYTKGIACQLWQSKSALGHRNGLRVRVYGTQGSAEWFQMEPEVLYMSDNRGGLTMLDRGTAEVELAAEDRYTRFKAGHPAGFIEAFANYYYDIADALIMFGKSGKYDSLFVFGAETAEEGLRMCEAMEQSSHSKRWESVKC